MKTRKPAKNKKPKPRSRAAGAAKGPKGRAPSRRSKSTRSTPSRSTAKQKAPQRTYKTSDDSPKAGEQIEGRQAVRELLLAGRREVKEILLIKDQSDAEVLSDIEMLASEQHVSIKQISRNQFEKEALTSSHQGVIARARAINFVSIETLFTPEAFLLVLDGITDPHNLGSILRIAECAGVSGVILPKHRSARISPTVMKSAAGAAEHVNLSVVGGIPAALNEMKKQGITTIGLDAGGKEDLFTSPRLDNRPIALVLGAEGSGLSRLVTQRVDTIVSIPLLGELNSLNVANATAVACFEVVRRTRSTKEAGTP